MRVCLLCVLLVIAGSVTILNIPVIVETLPVVVAETKETEGDFLSEISEAFPVIFDLFDKAELVTGVPSEILRGIAATESYFKERATGDNGLSHGMFQLHSRWHEERVKKWGKFNPFDPEEAAIIAGYVLADNFATFGGNWDKAIAAYRQGVGGVRKNGIGKWYVDDVLNWRKNEEKMMSFFLFLGITGIEGKEYVFDSGTPFAYQVGFDYSSSVQIPRRGCSGFPYQ